MPEGQKSVAMGLGELRLPTADANADFDQVLHPGSRHSKRLPIEALVQVEKSETRSRLWCLTVRYLPGRM